MSKVKVLYFVDRMLRGGIQSLIIDWIPRFDKNKIQVDVLLLDDGKEYELERTLKEMGCNVYKLNGIWIKKPSDYFKYKKSIDEFYKKNHDYDVVHLHSSSKNFLVLKYAKKYGIKKRISHSHNIGFQTKNILKKLIGNILKYPLKKYSTDFYGCSEIAGKWMFGKKIVKSEKFFIIHNAVDYKKFEFDLLKRKEIRNKLKINDEEIVIGNVGRFSPQKNHTFLIGIFYEILKINPNCKLLLIGTGDLEEDLKKKAKELGIKDKVIFAGFKNNVNEYLNVMDYFVFPSLYEGLGLVLIEAQANGLQCFTSSGVVPKEAQVSNSLYYISLNENEKEWAQKILKHNKDRKNNYKEIKEKGYIIDDVIETLTTEYMK